VLLPVESTEWGKILSAASERGFRRVEIGQPDRSSRSTTTIAAVVEHRP
jgi:hypothetical protein